MQDTVAGPAIVIANGHFQSSDAKVAHGLVRDSDRFRIVAVIDPDCAGADAGTLLDGTPRDIPVLCTIADAVNHGPERPEFGIVGIATQGGLLTPSIRSLLMQAIDSGLSVVNGLHSLAADDAELAVAARHRDVSIIDLRRPKALAALHFWSGAIRNVRAPRIAMLGTDCAVGKRTTARLLLRALAASGIHAEMIYTGQTGWLQGARYGFILDSTPNDFVSGELEDAVLRCDREASPDVMLIEGQSSLRNPSGPCGVELLISAEARGVILQHAPHRQYFSGYEPLRYRLPSIESEIALIKQYGARTLAVALNTEGLPENEQTVQAQRYSGELGIPVVRPIEDGVEALVPTIRQFVETHS